LGIKLAANRIVTEAHDIDDVKFELITLGSGAHALASHILGNPDDAPDAVQDAFTTVLGRPLAYDVSK